jgi:hypothetical protein
MERVWFDDPQELIKTDRLMVFWPTKDQTPEERVNAVTRFMLYSVLISYPIRRDSRIVVLAVLVVAAMFVLYKRGMVLDSAHPSYVDGERYNGGNCQKPTLDNPMANVLLSDINDNPNRPPACDFQHVKGDIMKYLNNTLPFDAGRSRSALPEFQRNAVARQFVTQPVSTVPGAQTDFAEWLYGEKFSPICRNDQSSCSPNARGAQLEAFGGLQANLDRR